jgi:hypothetical protein
MMLTVLSSMQMRTSSAASAHTVSSVDSAHAALHATVPKPRDHSAMQGGIYDLVIPAPYWTSLPPPWASVAKSLCRL